MKKKVQFHETWLPVSRRIVQIVLIFLPAFSVLLPPASADAKGSNSRWPDRQNTTSSISAVNGIRGSLTNFPVLINISDTNLTSGQVQSQGNDILFTSSDGTTNLPQKREKCAQSIETLMEWINISGLSSSISTIIYMWYRNSPVNTRQHAEEVFSPSDLRSGRSDLGEVVDAGMPFRKELA